MSSKNKTRTEQATRTGYTLIDVPFNGESVVYSFPASLTAKELRAEVMRVIPTPQNEAVVKMLTAKDARVVVNK